MATSVNARNDVWMDGVTVAGQDLRLQQAGAMLLGASSSGATGIATRAGVRPGLGSPLLVSASSGMNITINAGTAFVQGTASATAGIYTACLDTTATLTVTTSDPTNPRIDNVIAQVVDNGNNTSTTTINIQAGTPAGSPVAPTLPANSLLLATIAVGAAVSSIVAGNITDKRVYTAGLGGIVPVVNSTDQPPAAVTPVYRHRLDVTATAGAVSPLESSVNGTTWTPVFDPSGFTWAPYTPAWSSGSSPQPSLGNGGLTGRYFKIGRFVAVFLTLSCGSTTTFGTGIWTFSLPYNCAYTGVVGGAAYATIGSTTSYGIAYMASNTAVQFQFLSTGSFASPTVPGTWTTGSFLNASFFYESTT